MHRHGLKIFKFGEAMKINYFAYYLTKAGSDEKVLFDIRPFLKAFCRLDAPAFKASFKYSDELLFLLPHVGDTFLFIITRNSEVIRKINTSDMKIEDIQQLLDEKEHIGFASYVLIKDDFIGFASTTFAPKFIMLNHFINEIFENLGIVEHKLSMIPLSAQSSKKEVINMPFIGTTRVALTKENGFLKNIVGQFGVSTKNIDDIESIEVIIRPAKGKNAKEPVTEMLNALPDAGVSKLITKAKSSLMPYMTDLYLVGEGAISDSISNVKEDRIAANLTDKAEANQRLKAKLAEIKENEDFDEDSCDGILRYHNDDTWSEFVLRLQNADSVEQ